MLDIARDKWVKDEHPNLSQAAIAVLEWHSAHRREAKLAYTSNMGDIAHAVLLKPLQLKFVEIFQYCFAKSPESYMEDETAYFQLVFGF